jgi:hypothetical protein
MIKDCVDHMTLNPEGALKLLVMKSWYFTNPVTEDTLLGPFVIVLNAWAFRLAC